MNRPRAKGESIWKDSCMNLFKVMLKNEAHELDYGYNSCKVQIFKISYYFDIKSSKATLKQCELMLLNRLLLLVTSFYILPQKLLIF